MSKLSVVVSVYNEELVLPMFYEEVLPHLDSLPWDYELIFVNDGSSDNSVNIIKDFTMRNEKVKLLDFSRNFGHEAAMIAGIDYATGDGVVCMDSDLQHPPVYLSEIVKKFEEGYEVITMVRTKNKDAGIIKNITSHMFYKVLNSMSYVKFESNASDFFALNKIAADVLRKDYRERVRFLRGYVQSIGFHRATIEYEAVARGAGKSKYSIKNLIKFSITALLSFSDSPLKIGTTAGCIVGIAGIILTIYTIIMKFAYDVPSGYSTIIVAMCVMFAMHFFVIGIIGEYISILFKEIKDRPIYIVREKINMQSEDSDNA